MNYEIYTTASGAIRVNIDNHSYPLLNADGGHPVATTGHMPGETVSSRVFGHVRGGEYGDAAQAWADACLSVGLKAHEIRFSTQGVINALGDRNSVGLPWKAEYPRDHLRAA